MKVRHRLKTPQTDYVTQRSNSRTRCIPFCFTYEEWVQWWVDHLGPDWYQKRGRAKDQYCMARLGDKGPYVAWNVECLTNSENVKAMRTNGSSARGQTHTKAKLTEREVRRIYLEKGTDDEIALKYKNVKKHQIYRIRSGRSWGHFTLSLGQPGWRYKRAGRGTRTDLLISKPG